MGQILIADQFLKIWNQEKRDESEAFYSSLDDNVLIDSPIASRQGKGDFRFVMDNWLQAFPDIHVKKSKNYVYNNLVVSKWTAKGCHYGPFQQFNPTEKMIEYHGETVFVFNDQNKIVHYIAKVNLLDIFRQIEPESVSQTIIDLNRLNEREEKANLIRIHYPHLTKREIDCLSLGFIGFSAKQIGILLTISHRTVQSHVGQAIGKLGCTSRMQAMERLLADNNLYIFQNVGTLICKENSQKLLFL